MTIKRRKFFSRCVGWPKDFEQAKDFLDDHGQEIPRDHFLKLVDRAEMKRWERDLGYDRHLTMADDWHVRYFVEPNTAIPFFVHSAIEHVFASREEIEALERRLEADAARDPLLVIDRPGALSKLDPENDSYTDRLDEALDALLSHQGAVLIIEDESSACLSSYDGMQFERSLAVRRDCCEIHRVFVGESAPEAFPGPRLSQDQLAALRKELATGIDPVVFCEKSTERQYIDLQMDPTA